MTYTVAPIVSRRTLISGLQAVVAITLATFAYLIYDSISDQREFGAGLVSLQPGWLLVAAVMGLQEGVFGGIRICILGRVLWPQLKLRTAVASEFVMMFCAGVTPGQAGAVPAQMAVLVHGGMPFGEAAATQLIVGTCTITFFLTCAAIIFGMEQTGLMALTGGAGLDVLIGVSFFLFGGVFIGFVLAALFPDTLKAIVRGCGRPLGPLGRSALRLMKRVRPLRARAEAMLSRPGSLVAKLEQTADDVHNGVRIYFRRGKLAYLGAQLLTWGFFGSRFAVAYFILLGLGIDTTPNEFVAWGPPLLQVVLIQALLNFALYVSPTPGASGIAEAGSIWLMAPWVRGAFELPYLVFWRLFALFLSMFVGGIYVFRYLGADVIEKNIEASKAPTDPQSEDG